MVETTGDGSGWVWIRKHTGFVHDVFHDLGSWRMGQRGEHYAEHIVHGVFHEGELQNSLTSNNCQFTILS